METSERPTEEETTSEIGATAAAAAPRAEPEPEENVLGNPDETTDAILEVEGRELHANRAVLAHYSPVFRAMFYSSFKERSAVKIPLPGKRYTAMVTFYNVLYPRKASDKCLINDNNLIRLLSLADEFQTDQLKVECQNYIRGQLCEYFRAFYRCSVIATYGSTTKQSFNGLYDLSVQHLGRGTMQGQTLTKEAMIEKLILYLWACDDHQLPGHRETIKSLLVDMSTCVDDVVLSEHYSSTSHATRADLLETLCRKFDGSRK